MQVLCDPEKLGEPRRDPQKLDRVMGAVYSLQRKGGRDETMDGSVHLIFALASLM